MKQEPRILYREHTPWAPWVYMLLWGAMLGSALLIVVGPGSASGSPAWAAGLLVLTGAVIHLLFGGLTVVLVPGELRVGLGMGWPLRTRIPLDHIHSLESVTYHPLRQFGGWGLRGTKRMRAWTARGNQAVLLLLTDGREIWVGSDNPGKLETRIRNAMGVGASGR